MKTLLIIHHSHTDIGYTEQQRRVERWHVDYIRQAMALVQAGRERTCEQFSGFRWVCESFRTVELFLERANDDEIEDFCRILRRGEIGLSASYLNFNELADTQLLRNLVRRAADFGRDEVVKINSAMTADINGHGPGFARALLDNGVSNLFTCIHTHHGLYPLGRTQTPFWWETPRGDSLLVWSGEHYHFGNELGVVPGAVSSYTIKDECDAPMIFGDNWSVAEIRIPRYFEQLAKRGYELPFAPVMASGLRTDNAPPSAGIMDFCERWNREHGREIRVEMCNLDEFFERLAPHRHAFPHYKGDWPDWWSDGPSSDPGGVRIFRQAQRDLAFYRALRKRRPKLRRHDLSGIETDLAHYAEHTFSHCDSISRPWGFLAHCIPAAKRAYASRALEGLLDLIDEAHEELGAAPLRADRPLRYRVVNPFPFPLADALRLQTHPFEFNERGLDRGGSLFDAAGGESLPTRLELNARGGAFCTFVRLAPGETRDYELRPLGPGAEALGDPPTGEVWKDREDEDGVLETPQLRLAWRLGEGLHSLLARSASGLSCGAVSGSDSAGDVSSIDSAGDTSGIDSAGNASGIDSVGDASGIERELLRSDRAHNAFTPLREITPREADQDLTSVRGAMGLNRKGANVERSAGRLVRVATGPDLGVFSTLRLDYELAGAGLCRVELKIWHDAPRLDAVLRLHKHSYLEPENVYLSLPFGCGAERGALYLDRGGAALRPRLDQIPGSLTDFYSVQSGWALCADDFGLALAMPDQHLLQIGPLAHGERLLAGDPRLALDPELPYAWLMNNFWETNFAAQLGGVHEFRFHLAWGRDLAEPGLALTCCRAMEQGLRVFRLGTDSE